MVGMMAYTPRFARALKGSAAAMAAYAALALSSLAGGKAICRMTYKSPGGDDGMPRPLSRNLLPACAPAGIFKSTVPPGVGVFTDAPSAASHGATGRSRYKSRPTILYKGCG